MVVDETLTDEKMDNDILRALHRRAGQRNETKNVERDNPNGSQSIIQKARS